MLNFALVGALWVGLLATCPQLAFAEDNQSFAKPAKQDTATEWLWTYNHERPNMALGGITPAQKLKRKMQTQIAA